MPCLSPLILPKLPNVTGHAYLSGVAGTAACALLMSMRRPEVDCGGGLAAYNSMPRGYS